MRGGRKKGRKEGLARERSSLGLGFTLLIPIVKSDWLYRGGTIFVSHILTCRARACDAVTRNFFTTWEIISRNTVMGARRRYTGIIQARNSALPPNAYLPPTNVKRTTWPFPYRERVSSRCLDY